jgi:hypothetical protein
VLAEPPAVGTGGPVSLLAAAGRLDKQAGLVTRDVAPAAVRHSPSPLPRRWTRRSGIPSAADATREAVQLLRTRSAPPVVSTRRGASASDPKRIAVGRLCGTEAV